jgi:hypothetical protein
MPGWDEDQAVPGRSMEIDAEVHAITKEVKGNRIFKANQEDPAAGSVYDEPQGNGPGPAPAAPPAAIPGA